MFKSIRTLTITGTALALFSGCTGGAVPISSGSALGYAQTGLTSATAGAKLYVLNGGATNVTVYRTNGSGPNRTIKNGLRLQVRAIAVDSTSNVYVAMAPRRGTAGAVNEYAPGKSQVVRKLKVIRPVALAVDAVDNLYVLGLKGVNVFAPGSSTPSETITDGIKNPTSMVLDRTGNIYVGNGENADNVTVYSSSGTLIRTINQGVLSPTAMTLDNQGRLYVVNAFPNDTVTVYQPGQNTVWKTIESTNNGELDSIALDADQNVYVASSGGNAVEVFSGAPNFTFTRTITDGVNSPSSLAFDREGALFVANIGSNTVTEYMAGSSEVDDTISNGIKTPTEITIR